jgi:hypothetical protein
LVQFDLMKPVMKAPGPKCLKPDYDELPSILLSISIRVNTSWQQSMARGGGVHVGESWKQTMGRGGGVYNDAYIGSPDVAIAMPDQLDQTVGGCGAGGGAVAAGCGGGGGAAGCGGEAGDGTGSLQPTEDFAIFVDALTFDVDSALTMAGLIHPRQFVQLTNTAYP